MGVASREIRGPDGKAWRARINRFRAPRWRQSEAWFSEEPMFGGAFFVFDFFLALVSAMIAGPIIPLLARPSRGSADS